MKKVWVCLLVAGSVAFTGCGMSARERIALQEAQNRAAQLEMQRQRELAEQQRRSQLTPEQRHEEDLANIRKEGEQAKAIGAAIGVGACIFFGC